VKRSRKSVLADPIALIRACHRDARRVAPVPGAPGYFVADDGRVFSLRRRRDPLVLKPLHVTGTYVVHVHEGDQHIPIGRLVLGVFGPGPRSRRFAAHHIDGDPRNNRLENLRWIPFSELARDHTQPARKRRVKRLQPAQARALIRQRYPDAGALEPIAEAPKYFVDDLGRVYSPWAGAMRRLRPRGAGAKASVSLVLPSGEVRQVRLATIVARAFLGDRPSRAHLQIAPKDGDPGNYRASNLEWRRLRPGGRIKITAEAVRAIRALLASGARPAHVARAFETSPGAIAAIGAGATHRRVQELPGADPIAALSLPLRARVSAMMERASAGDPSARADDHRAAVAAAFPEARDLREIEDAPGYWVDRAGAVYSTRRWPDRPPKRLAGRSVDLCAPTGERRSARVSTLVAQEFLPPRPAGARLAHRDGDTNNAAASNLEWVVPAEPDAAAPVDPETAIRGAFPGTRRLEPVPDTFRVYWVSEDGEVFSLLRRPPRRLAPSVVAGRPGAIVVLAPWSAVRWATRVDHLVAEAFLDPPRSPRLVLQHKDGDPTHNAASNLVWLRRTIVRAPSPVVPRREADAAIRARFSGAGAHLVPIAGAPGYFVDELGQVFSLRRGRAQQQSTRGGRVRIGGSQPGSDPMIAHVVAAAFLPRRPEGSMLVHLNGDRSDHRAKNLAWRPRQNLKRKLDPNTVRALRWLRGRGVSTVEMARCLGMTQGLISQLCLGHIYRDVKPASPDLDAAPASLQPLIAAARAGALEPRQRGRSRSAAAGRRGRR